MTSLMNKKSLFPGLRILLALGFMGLVLSGCSKDDDECTKTITVPELRVGGAYYPAYKMEVPCDFEDPEPVKSAI